MNSKETLSIRSKDRKLTDQPEIIVKNISFGVNLYKNALSKDNCSNYASLLSKNLDGSKDYHWLPSDNDDSIRIGTNDFLVTEEFLGPENEKNKFLYDMNFNVLDLIKKCVSDYATSWDMGIHHYQTLNFVRYLSPTGYFAPHHDDDPTTVRTITAILYLNDDYEGGNLVFSRLDNLVVKPETGDLIVFPASYLYEHESTLLTRGVKYCVIAAGDYRERG